MNNDRQKHFETFQYWNVSMYVDQLDGRFPLPAGRYVERKEEKTKSDGDYETHFAYMKEGTINYT